MRKIYGVKTATYHEQAAFYCESYADAFRLSETVNEWQIKGGKHEAQDFIVSHWLVRKEARDDQ